MPDGGTEHAFDGKLVTICVGARGTRSSMNGGRTWDAGGNGSKAEAVTH